MANKPSLMEPDYDEDSTGSHDMHGMDMEVFAELRKRFLTGSDEEACDAFCGMCSMCGCEMNEGTGYGEGKPKLKIEVC